jgi:hypothetical protein
MALPDGAVFLPWPQCLDGLLSPSEQVLAGTATVLSEILTLGDLPRPTRQRVVGYPYGGGRTHHKGLLVPQAWVPAVTRVLDPALVQFAAGQVESIFPTALP